MDLNFGFIETPGVLTRAPGVNRRRQDGAKEAGCFLRHKPTAFGGICGQCEGLPSEASVKQFRKTPRQLERLAWICRQCEGLPSERPEAYV
jgi:hypothetical protein